jgi:hypothetical protein
LFVPPGFDLVEDGASFRDIPLDQVSDFLFHRPVVATGEGLQGLDHFGGHIPDGNGGHGEFLC